MCFSLWSTAALFSSDFNRSQEYFAITILWYQFSSLGHSQSIITFREACRSENSRVRREQKRVNWIRVNVLGAPKHLQYKKKIVTYGALCQLVKVMHLVSVTLVKWSKLSYWWQALRCLECQPSGTAWFEWMVETSPASSHCHSHWETEVQKFAANVRLPNFCGSIQQMTVLCNYAYHYTGLNDNFYDILSLQIDNKKRMCCSYFTMIFDNLCSCHRS